MQHVSEFQIAALDALQTENILIVLIVIIVVHAVDRVRLPGAADDVKGYRYFQHGADRGFMQKLILI